MVVQIRVYREEEATCSMVAKGGGCAVREDARKVQDKGAAIGSDSSIKAVEC